MAVVLESLATLSVLVFVVTSMLSMGLSLTVSQILDPLRDASLVAKALVANFVLIPTVAYALVLVFPLSEGQSIGIILLATAAGAPFLPKLVEVAKGSIAFGVGLMVLLMVATVVYVPLVLPLLLPGVQVNPLDIASSLVVLMLIPLAIGLVVKARYDGIATSVEPVMSQTSTTALVFLTVLMLVLNFDNLVSVVGTGVILALFVFVAVSFAVGYVLGGPVADNKSVLGLGTGQRNISAALVVAAQNFQDPDVVTILLVGALVMLVVLMVAGGELGRRSEAPSKTGGLTGERGDQQVTPE
ncbi:bile acid:sodium symporter family protein [Haloferax sp. MBLA0076]|uniref:Bile acid:sodium symporter family protein n=1 Tax=Haloferax litoreum TaxID=2666140 RepID=A0A6A8GK59_9EURY|nr:MULTISPECIES: bile acid:sodium symporter [Haloferax]KAB1190584.1 bile acid:sodium symporter family protein [Haloferax sp. CBA1148]MRX23573.1 bile acid:sodium symporter family protein [Haloferax litoreum]